MSATTLISITIALTTVLSCTNSAFALNPQPEPPNIPAVADGPKKPVKGKQIKVRPSPCKENDCR